MNYLAGALLWIGVLFSRPFGLGYAYAYIGVGAAFMAGFLALAAGFAVPLKRKSLNYFLISMTLSASFVALIGFQSIDQAIKLGAILFIFNIAGFLVVRSSPEAFITTTRWLLRIIVLSGCVTGVVFLMSGIDATSSAYSYYTFEVRDRTEYEISMLRVPISTINFNFSLNGVAYGRSSFLLVEPGIAPVLIVLWRCLEPVEPSFRSFLCNVVFLLAASLTFSTTILIVIPAFFAGVSYFRSGRVSPAFIVLAVLFSVVGVAFFLYAPGIGYIDKMETHTSSFDDRIGWFSDDSTKYYHIAKVAVAVLHIWTCWDYLARKRVLIIPTVLIVGALNVFYFWPFYLISLMVLVALKQREQSSA